MRPITVTVGPLAATSATSIGLSQTPGTAQGLAMNGSLGTNNTANSICLSQSGSAATALLINGALAQIIPQTGLKGAAIPNTLDVAATGQQITITSAGNDSGITFALVGMDSTNTVVQETVGGTNTSTAVSSKIYKTVLSLTPSGNTASTVTVGTNGLAVLSKGALITFASGGNDSGVTFTIYDVTETGNVRTETVIGASAGTATSVLTHKNIYAITAAPAPATTVTIGNLSEGYSQEMRLDGWANGRTVFQAVATGTVNYTVESSMDDPNSPWNPVLYQNMTWDTSYLGTTGATASSTFSIDAVPTFVRVFLNSGTGSVALTATQFGVAPY